MYGPPQVTITAVLSGIALELSGIMHAHLPGVGIRPRDQLKLHLAREINQNGPWFPLVIGNQAADPDALV